MKIFAFCVLIFFCSICIVGCSGEEKKFNEVQGKNSITAYENFLKEYPDGKYREQAMKDIDKLTFQEAKKQNAITSYRDYLEKFPNGMFAKQASDLIEAIIFDEAKNGNSISSYKDYLKKYPDGAFADQAKDAIEQIHYNESKSKNNVVDYLAFLISYPDSKYSSEIQNIVEDIRASEMGERLEKIFLEKGEVPDMKKLQDTFSQKYYDDYKDIRTCFEYIGKMARMVKNKEYIDMPDLSAHGLYLSDHLIEESYVSSMATLKVYGKDSTEHLAAENVHKFAPSLYKYFKASFDTLKNGPKEIRLKTFQACFSNIEKGLGKEQFASQSKQLYKFEYDNDNKIAMQDIFKKNNIPYLETLDQKASKEANDIMRNILMKTDSM